MLCKLRTNLQGVKINGFSCFDEQNTNEGHSSAERFNDQGVLHAILCFRTSSCLYKPDETSLVAFLLSLDDSHWYSSLHYSFIVFSRGTCWEPSQTAWWHASWSAGTSGPRDLSILRVASRRFASLRVAARIQSTYTMAGALRSLILTKLGDNLLNGWLNLSRKLVSLFRYI